MSLYEKDLVAWSDRTAALLRQHNFDELDVDNLADEIEDMGENRRRALESRLTVLLTHLLKWQFQPERRTRSWKTTIVAQRIALERLLKKAPSLQPYLIEILEEVYSDAIDLTAAETDLAPDRFPNHCPYTPEEILNRAFLPSE